MIVARGGKRGKTAGRGGKGQSARAGNKRRPEWRDILKRVPKLRGRGKNSNKSIAERAVVVNLAALEAAFADKETVSPTTLVLKGVVATKSGHIPRIKILGDGEIKKSLTVSGCEISATAVARIVEAKGSVESLKNPTPVKSQNKAKTNSGRADDSPVLIVEAKKSSDESPKKDAKTKLAKGKVQEKATKISNPKKSEVSKGGKSKA